MKIVQMTKKRLNKWLDKYFKTHDIKDSYFLIRYDHTVELITFIRNTENEYQEALPTPTFDEIIPVGSYLEKFEIIECLNAEEAVMLVLQYEGDYSFIDDCLTYKVFDDAEWFKDCYDQEVPDSFINISKKLKRELKQIIKVRKKDAKREEKAKQQRYERGYADSDVWNLCNWFICTTRPMLQDLAKNHMGFPATIDYEYYEKHKNELGVNSYDEWCCWPSDKDSEEYKRRSTANELCSQYWTDILNQMIFLLNEMDEDTCSKQNPYQEQWWHYHELFDKKYPKHGDELKTPEELQRDKDTHTWLHVGPERDPEFGKEYIKVQKKFLDYNKKISKYRDTCKNKFFKLFSKYFWDLWD